MAATATASRSAPARRAPARKPASRPPARGRANTQVRRRRARHTPIAGFVPVAVGRTAGAVGGIADSGLVVRLTRSRLWIGLLGGLLVGIVALNVMALSLSASSSDAARQAEELQRSNSALRGEIATKLSSPEIQATAAALGLINPEAGSIRYLRPSPADAAEAARRLRAGELGGPEYVAPLAEAPVAPTDPATVATTPPATAPPADPATAAPAAETTAPATETAAPPPTTPEAPVSTPDPAAPVDGGGVAAP